MVINKFDEVTRDNLNNVPTLKDLLPFLKDRSNILRKMEIKFGQSSSCVSRPKLLRDDIRYKQLSKSFITNNREYFLCTTKNAIQSTVLCYT